MAQINVWHRSLGRESCRRSRRSVMVSPDGERTDCQEICLISSRGVDKFQSTLRLLLWSRCLGCLRPRIYFACLLLSADGIERTTVKPTSQPNKRKGSSEPRYDRMASAHWSVGRSLSLSDGRSLGRSAVACCLHLFYARPGGYHAGTSGGVGRVCCTLFGLPTHPRIPLVSLLPSAHARPPPIRRHGTVK